MTLRNFQIFIEVCNQGTMSAAAQKLFITQSAISQIIRDMENHYGVALFQRVSHKLYLTEAGKKLYSHAIKMVQYNELIETSMADHSKLTTLRIGCFSAYIMIDLVAEYRRFHPELFVSMVHTTRSITDMLLSSSQLDLAIVCGIFNLNNYNYYPLTTLETVFACSKNSRLSPLLEADHPAITLEELAQFPIYICSVSEDVEQSLNSAFLSHGIHYSVAGTFLHYDAVTRTAIEDLGITIINRTNFERSSHLLKEIRVENLEIKSHVSIICSKENALNPVIMDFIKFAQNNFDHLKATYPEKTYPGMEKFTNHEA